MRLIEDGSSWEILEEARERERVFYTKRGQSNSESKHIFSTIVAFEIGYILWNIYLTSRKSDLVAVSKTFQYGFNMCG